MKQTILSIFIFTLIFSASIQAQESPTSEADLEIYLEAVISQYPIFSCVKNYQDHYQKGSMTSFLTTNCVPLLDESFDVEIEESSKEDFGRISWEDHGITFQFKASSTVDEDDISFSIRALKKKNESKIRLKNKKLFSVEHIHYQDIFTTEMKYYVNATIGKTKHFLEYQVELLPLEEIYTEEELEQINSSTPNDRVKVGVFDIGVNYNHHDIAYKFARDDNQQLIGLDTTDGNNLPYDWGIRFDGFSAVIIEHGTAVSSVLGKGDHTLIYPAKTYVMEGPEEIHKSYNLEIFEFFNEHDVKVINISSGYREETYREHFIQIIEKYPDILFVVSAGNEGVDINNAPFYPASLQYDNLITVAAVGNDGIWLDQYLITEDNDTSHFKSNYSVTLVDLAAPGVEVEVSVKAGGRDHFTGTSFSSPLVANAAAEILFLYPHNSPSDLKRIILCSVTVQENMRDKVVSSGVLNLEAALDTAYRAQIEGLDVICPISNTP
ncbi:MAG: S8 family serine peptidase [Bacteriovoracaceae bacterium]|jgi:hypothetical protein|nr:S8 family serine peptidase [Bacteriovoracaceae bacterium]